MLLLQLYLTEYRARTQHKQTRIVEITSDTCNSELKDNKIPSYAAGSGLQRLKNQRQLGREGEGMPLPRQAASRSQKSLSGGGGGFYTWCCKKHSKRMHHQLEWRFLRSRPCTAPYSEWHARPSTVQDLGFPLCGGLNARRHRAKSWVLKKVIHFKTAAQRSTFAVQPTPHRQKKGQFHFLHVQLNRGPKQLDHKDFRSKFLQIHLEKLNLSVKM